MIAVLNYILLLLAILFFGSCSGNGAKNTQRKKYKDACAVEQTGTKQFILDSNTSTSVSFLQYVPGDSLQRLSFLNTYSNSIYLYDNESGEFLDTIRFDKEGADGVGTIQGYRYHNDDSIFIYPYAAGRVYLANNQGKVQEIYRLYDMEIVSEDTTRFVPVPYMETGLPMFFRNGTLFISGGFLADTSLEKKDNTFVNIAYDVRTQSPRYAVPYPEVYRQYNWGNGEFFYRQPGVTMTSDGALLYNFPAVHELWRYNPATGVCDSLYAGSNRIDRIEPFTKEKKMFADDVPGAVISDWYYSQASYESVFADPYKGLYYRIARLPKPTHKRNTFNDKPVVIIVLDKELNYVGEELLPEGVSYDTFNSYVSPEGLHIHLNNPQDEDHLTFYTYNAKF